MASDEWIVEMEDYGSPHQYNESEPQLTIHEKEVNALLSLVKDVERDMKNYNMDKYQNMRAKNDIAHYYQKIKAIKDSYPEYFV